MKEKISQILQASIDTKSLILQDAALLARVDLTIAALCKALRAGHKILFCGNGGSAADAQHLAAEFSGRFYTDRHPLPAEALHCNTSYLTAVANDYGYEHVYSRLLKGIGKPEDILIGLSTSGNSQNIVNAFETAKNMNIQTIAFTGSKSSKMSELADLLINVPSTDTPRIQECHITIGHIVCQMVESELFKDTQ